MGPMGRFRSPANLGLLLGLERNELHGRIWLEAHPGPSGLLYQGLGLLYNFRASGFVSVSV